MLTVVVVVVVVMVMAIPLLLSGISAGIKGGGVSRMTCISKGAGEGVSGTRTFSSSRARLIKVFLIRNGGDIWCADVDSDREMSISSANLLEGEHFLGIIFGLSLLDRGRRGAECRVGTVVVTWSDMSE